MYLTYISFDVSNIPRYLFLLLFYTHYAGHREKMSATRISEPGSIQTMSGAGHNGLSESSPTLPESTQSIQLVGGDDESGLERIVTPSNAQPAMRPVSRRRQITILLCAFSDVFVTIGLNQAYGVFLQHYLTDGSSPVDPFLAPSEVSNKAMVAFVGTAGAGLTWGGSIFVNPLMARSKDPRYVTMAGAILIGLGYVLASFCHKVGMGRGNSILLHLRN